ncbi:MAG: FkbM family methyltransferase [Gimesia sp.]
MVIKNRIKRYLPKWILLIHRAVFRARLNWPQQIRYYKECLLGQSPYARVTLNAHKICLGAHDGEWCVAEDLLSEKPVVLSFGIGTDISWDLDMINKYNAEVYAFDPTPISLQWLSKKQLPDNFNVIPLGISDTNGIVKFGLPVNHGVSFSIDHSGVSQRVEKCEVRTFQFMLESLGITKADIVKLDIEGTEYKVLEDILSSNISITQVLIEFHHRLFVDEGVSMTRNAFQLLAKHGYQLFYRSPRGLEYCFAKPAGNISK